MPWVHFHAPHEHRPNERTIQTFKPGPKNVTRAVAEEAVQLGRAKRIKTPARGAAPELPADDGAGD